MRLTAAAVFGIAAASVNPAFACEPIAFLGSICANVFNYCPPAYMEAAGQELQIRDYDTLFAVLGTTFGGDGVRTFKLPDLRARELVGENPSGANGLPATTLGTVVAAKNDLSPTENKGQALALKFCIAVNGNYPARQ